MPDFATLFSTWHWVAIRDCPGRYVLDSDRDDIVPADLLGDAAELREYQTLAARDPVLVAHFGDGGLIAYRHRDGSFTLTLNTLDGLTRKLTQLGIAPAGDAPRG